MHIMEGYLPMGHALFWAAASLPVVIHGGRKIIRILEEKPQAKMLLAASGAYVFVLSALKLPSVTGSCSHPTGTGLAASLFGPSATAVLGTIVLLFQALLLAHGGITTLGANAFSMALVGPWVSYGLWKLGRNLGLGFALTLFLAAAMGDLATYVSTAVQLALAYPDPVSGFAGALVKFGGIFALTQVPLAVAEGLLTVVVMDALSGRSLLSGKGGLVAGEVR